MSAIPASLAVVIGTLDRLAQLQLAIAAICDRTQGLFHVYVTDAGSTDGTIEYLRSLDDPRITTVLEGRRLGQATAYNRVFRMLREPYVCWLSDDNEIINHGLDHAVAILEQEPQIGLVALKVRDVKGPFVSAPYIGGISQLGILNVNQGVLRTADLRRVGGFSEWFQLYGIDPDLTAKILLSGLDVVYTREVAIHHHRNWPADPTTPEYRRMMERQREYQEKYLRKYGEVLPSDPAFEHKRQLWARWKRRRPELARLDSAEPVAGALPRDWHNLMMARFISRREGRNPHGLYHLRQHVPTAMLPTELPQDPF